MPPPGGSKDHVKIVPFNTKPPAPSDYSHLTGLADLSFARSLAASSPDPRKSTSKNKANKEGTGDGGDLGSASADSEKDESGGGKDASSPSKKTTSKIDPDDLARFLEAEGGGDPADMCNLPRCVEIVSQIILNDKNSKIERALLQEEIAEMMRSLKESEKEEEKVNQMAEALVKEQLALEKQAESQAATLHGFEEQKVALEAEKKGFSSKQALLEKDQRQWVSKVRTSQAALAKAIWRKPGEPFDDNETSSIFDGSVTSIRTASKRALELASTPSLLSYERQANLNRVSDYNEIPPYKPTFPIYIQHHIERDNVEKVRSTTAVAAAVAMQGLRDNSSSGGGSSSSSVRNMQDHMSQHSSSASASGGRSSVLTAGFRFRESPSSSSIAAGGNSHSLMGDSGSVRGDHNSVSDSTVVTFRKSVALMPPAVREFIKSGAAVGLSLSRGGGSFQSGYGDAASSPGHGLGMERRVSPIRGRPQHLKPLLDGLGGSVRGGGGDDNHSVATMSTLGNGSFVSLAGASSLLQSPGNRNCGSSINSSSSKALQLMQEAAQLEDFKRRTQPPLPKHTGKLRVNASGVGTLNKKSKSISDLLAEDEALNLV